MYNVSVKDLVNASAGVLLSGDPEEMILHMTTDSRAVPENALFVPIVGANSDGHAYINKAAENGARAILTAKKEAFQAFKSTCPENTAAFILVDDTTAAVQNIAKMARGKLSLPAVGVTGSVGKTTTREMVALALSAEKKVYKTDKNYNNWLGVPITLCEMSDDFDIAVLELGLNVRGELGLISSLTRLSAAIITNIGVAHMEYYGTREEICKEKFTVTEGFWPEDNSVKVLILNGNDPYLMAEKDRWPYRSVLYGTEDNADYRAENIRRENGQTLFDVALRDGRRLPVALTIPGEHNVLNALAALAAADLFGVDLHKAAEALTGYTGYKNRLEQTLKDGVLIIDDTYNASPASMKAGLSVLCETENPEGTKRRIAVLGDMFELGEHAPEFHYEVGEYAADKPISALYLVGETAKEIGRAVREHGDAFPVFLCDNREEAAAALKASVQPGDIVYLKASNGMKLKEIAEELKK